MEEINSTIKRQKLGFGSYKKFQHQWYDDNPSWKLWVKEIPNDPTKFFCKVCEISLQCGASEIKKHSLSKKHIKKMEKMIPSNANIDIDINKKINEPSTSTSISEDEFDFNDRVQIAEIRLATFFVEHNLSFSMSSSLLSLMKDIGAEPAVLQTMTLGKTKLCHIVNNVICHRETERIATVLRNTKFSVYEDETSDITNNKWLTLMVRYVEPSTLKIRCELLKMIHLDASDCSASKLFEAFSNELKEHQIPLHSIVGLSCDNASVMMGKHSSFQQKLLQESPHLVTLPCVCHSAALAANNACTAIPNYCEDFMKGIVTFINASPKRTALFTNIQMSYDEHLSVILRYAETRWLTRHKCISRILENWKSLGQFLLEQSCEKVQQTHKLLTIYQNPSTKAYLLFLEFTLNEFNKFNAKFQSRETMIHELQAFSQKLLEWFADKFIASFSNTSDFDKFISEIDLTESSNLINLHEIDLGFECNKYLNDLLSKNICSLAEIDEIRQNCLLFYKKAFQQIKQRLPYNNAFLKSLKIFDKSIALFEDDRDTTAQNVVRIASKFGIFEENDIIKEWKDLININLSQRNMWATLSFDDMWIAIGSYRTAQGDIKFNYLHKLLSIIRSLPHSNAEAERVFSILPDAKTKKRNRMSKETLNAICVIKYALKAHNITAHTMKITRKYLQLMNAENLYGKKKTDL